MTDPGYNEVSVQEYLDNLLVAEDSAETSADAKRISAVRLALLAALADADEILS